MAKHSTTRSQSQRLHHRTARWTLLLFFLAAPWAYGEFDLNVQVEKIKDPKTGVFTLWFTNGELMPVTVFLDAEVVGYQSNIRPRIFTIPPATRALGQVYQPLPDAKHFRLAWNLKVFPGDATALPDTNHLYEWPWAHGARFRIDQGYLGSFSHRNLYALDFNLVKGDPIHAARDGRVVRVHSNETRGGLDPALVSKANLVDVLHADGSLANYAHMEFRGTAVTQGQWVRAGDLLGRCGWTGYGDGAHLHFAVSRATTNGARTFPTYFRGTEGERLQAQVGEWYVSRHGGKPLPPPPAQVNGTGLSNHRLPLPATGQLEMRQEVREDLVLLFLQNGLDQDMPVQISMTHKNLRPTSGFPSSITLPARMEIWYGTFRIVDGLLPHRVELTFLSPSSKPIAR